MKLTYKQTQEIAKEISILSYGNTPFEQCIRALNINQWAIQLTYINGKLSFEQTEKTYVPSLEYKIDDLQEEEQRIERLEDEICPERGHIILEALYQLYRFPTRDFVGDAIAYKIPLRVVLAPGPDIGIVKLNTTIHWIMCPDISLKEILKTNLEMANQEELKRWREQLGIWEEEREPFHPIKEKRPEPMSSYWDDRD